MPVVVGFLVRGALSLAGIGIALFGGSILLNQGSKNVEETVQRFNNTIPSIALGLIAAVLIYKLAQKEIGHE